MTTIVSDITLWIIHVISSLGYTGIFFFMALHSCIFIVPSEVVMAFSGYLVSTGRFSFFPVVLVATIGNIFGASFIYWLSHKGGRALILKYDRFFLVSQGELQKVEKFFLRFGIWAIPIGRCIPILAGLISIPAGLAKVKYWKFVALTFLGAVIWNTFLTFIGYKLGQNWTTIQTKFHYLNLLILAIIIVAIILWLQRHIKKSRPFS